ncbi:hypothetical protein GCM10012280_46640 [Wenjunlia tyrosinilytica]|uniref:DUF4352 domain-containing protein n=2 Tax=Wenjunlia tyrosinilytica TaxID=1544741 RepID=A0A918DZD9_9ACTN|nr:hypothetical protein GCM10012280_46640 [Wenjunlia tyrosinilytica]
MGSVGWYPYPVQPRNGAAVAALVLGILSVLAACSVLFFFIGVVLGALALILGLMGRARAKKGRATNGPMALTAVLLGVGGLLLSAAIGVLAVGTLMDEFDAVPLTGAQGTVSRPLGDNGTATYRGGLHVTVSAPKEFTPAAGVRGRTLGERAYRISVTVRNEGDRDIDTTRYHVLAEGGDEAQLDQIWSDTDRVGQGLPATVGPGRSATADFAFSVPQEEQVLDLELAPGWHYDSAYWYFDLRRPGT